MCTNILQSMHSAKLDNNQNNKCMLLFGKFNLQMSTGMDVPLFTSIIRGLKFCHS